MLPLSERQLQENVLQLLAHLYPQSFVFHVPNGGSRHPVEAARLKRQGVKAGVPDLVIVRPKGRVSWLELKSMKGGLSAYQRLLHRVFGALAHPVHVIKEIDQLPPLIAQWKREDAA